MRLRWLPETREDIRRLFEFLVHKDPVAAERAMALIGKGADNLLDMPEIGWPMGDNSERRELYLPFGAGSYVLRYRLETDAVVVIRVWHNRERRG